MKRTLAVPFVTLRAAGRLRRRDDTLHPRAWRSLFPSLAEWRVRGILHPRQEDLGPSANFTIRL